MARLILLLLFVLVAESFAGCTVYPCCFKRRRRDTGEIGTPTDTNIRTNFFHLIDLNNDDLFDGAEWVAEGGKQDEFTTILEDYDANGDGMISLDEFHTVDLGPSVKLFVEDVLGAEDAAAKWNDEIRKENL